MRSTTMGGIEESLAGYEQIPHCCFSSLSHPPLPFIPLPLNSTLPLDMIIRSYKRASFSNDSLRLRYWPMNEGNGFDFYDESPSMNNADLDVDVKDPRPAVYESSSCPVQKVQHKRATLCTYVMASHMHKTHSMPDCI